MGWGWLALVPCVFGLDLALPAAQLLPTGIPEARGCSVEVPPPRQGWDSLEPTTPTGSPSEPVPVATDGFFTMRARGYGLSLEQAQSELRVRVTDSDGVEISGDLRLLGDPRDYMFGWSAREPLPLGSRLNALLGVDASASDAGSSDAGAIDTGVVGGSYVLEVVGPPVPLPEPELRLGRWSRYYRGSGATVNCWSLDTCGSHRLDVPESVSEDVAVEASWIPPQTSTGVAWRVRMERSGSVNSESTADSWAFARQLTFRAAVPFSALEQRHCVRLSIEDLRNGEKRSTESCAEPGPLQGFGTDTLLQQCSEPPNEALTRAWCDLRPYNSPPVCTALRASENASDAEGPDSSDGDTAEVPTDNVVHDSSCQMGASGGAGGLSAVLSAAALCGLCRARRRR